jgi:four helix bundle protein
MGWSAGVGEPATACDVLALRLWRPHLTTASCFCWQLSARLRDEFIPITERPRVRRHRKFRDQVEDSTRSAPANIAEGFDRSNREFLRYLNIALGSLRESENHFDEAQGRKYINAAEHLHFRTLAKRAIRASEGLKAYLESRLEGPSQPGPT